MTAEGTMAGDVAGALHAVTGGLPGGGEERPGQLEMALAIERAVRDRRHLIVQAGTGTGKSFAYLVPLVVLGTTCVVATATLALQDQLATKDLPALAERLGRPVSFAILKGRRNYLCLARAAEVAGGGFEQSLDPGTVDGPDADAAPAPDEGGVGLDPDRLAAQVRRLLDWGATTSSGDVGDLDFEPHPRAWAMLSVGPQECPGAARCPQGAACFAERARQKAAEADVVVVNTHLYGAHLASGGQVLPPHDVVVFDEAHELEEVMTSSLGVEVSPGRLHALAVMARPLLDADEARDADLSDVADRLRRLLGDRVGSRVLGPRPSAPRSGPGGPPPEGRERAFFAPPDAGAPHDDELVATLELAGARIERLRAALLSAGWGGSDAGDTQHPSARSARDARRIRALSAASQLADDLARLSAATRDEVAWVELSSRSPVLRLSPIDVGPPLAGALWESVTAVLTSATIPPGLPERLGLDGFGVEQIDVGSPFDYRANSLLYVARHLPDPRQAGAAPLVHDELAALIALAGGRTLALFTSRRATEAAAEALRGRLDCAVLVQGERPKGRLLEAFAGDETSCLFATLGFWQGVDVPGRALSLVTLDRLPFGRPDDPLLVARRERAGPEAFASVDLPRVATLLAQGVGRLIRSATDTGVVAVLDRRLATAGYRRVLLDALPPMRRTVERAEVAAFFERTLGAGGRPGPVGSDGRSGARSGARSGDPPGPELPGGHRGRG